MHKIEITIIQKKRILDSQSWYTYSFEFVSNDYTIAPGHTLSLILYGNLDVDQTQLPWRDLTTIEVDTSSIVVECPVK